MHAVSLQSMLIASLGRKMALQGTAAVVLHITGLGYIATSRSPKAWLARTLTFGLMRAAVAHQSVWLLGENPDDICYVATCGIGRVSHSTIILGAGVDPAEFPALPPPDNSPPRMSDG